MSVQRFGAGKSVRARVTRTAWICSLIGLFMVALPASTGGRACLAQTDQAQTDDPTTPPPPPEPATAVPSPPSANAKPKQAAKPEAPKLESVTTEPESVATAAPRPTPPAKPLDPNQKAVADASANLLELANSLKQEVDKTSADTLSVAVIRKAGEIEQLARKIRGPQ
jgi:outer membrane biosynthesis protein TonB